ncbi:hypothetical protein BVRB_4g079190 [Beta vulgaris subsp. vulgaris]|nr:hypothetical protein BVRB_4g079190 [Beta vulgaris subsp. vulgaris]
MKELSNQQEYLKLKARHEALMRINRQDGSSPVD